MNEKLAKKYADEVCWLLSDGYHAENIEHKFLSAITEATEELRLDNAELLAEREQFLAKIRKVADAVEPFMLKYRIHGCFATDAVKVAVDKCEELQAIADKLPKTADGVAVVPGMNLWFVETRDTGKTWFVKKHEDIHISPSHFWIEHRAYSTEAAALAAKEQNDAE